jgi:hypothetical protein
MGVPSAAIVYTGAAGDMPGSNRGAAYSEGLGETLNIVNQGLEDIRSYEAERKKNQQEKVKAWDDFLMEDPDVWNIDLPKIQEKVTEYNEYIHGLMNDPKVDPRNLSTDQRKRINEMTREIKKQTNAAKMNAKIWDKGRDDVSKNPKEWDSGHATIWGKQFMNPDITPEERLSFAQANSIYKRNVELVDVVEKIDELMDEEEIKVNGRTMIKKDPEKFKNLLGIYFKDQVGSQDYEALITRYENDPAKLYEEATSLFKDMNPGKPKPITKSGGGSGSGGGGGKKDKEPEITITGQGKKTDSKWNQNYAINKISLGKTKPIYAYDFAGNAYANFVPQDGFYLRPEGGVTAIGYGTDADGRQVKVEVDYDTNMENFTGAGYPNIFDEFRSRTSVKSPTGKTYTGVPQGGF